MKTTVIVLIMSLIVLILTVFSVFKIKELKESNDFKSELILAQDEALEYSCRIICGNDTTYYEEYDNACAKVDSLYSVQL